jgi:YD repeat-containing protein
VRVQRHGLRPVPRGDPVRPVRLAGGPDRRVVQGGRGVLLGLHVHGDDDGQLDRRDRVRDGVAGAGPVLRQQQRDRLGRCGRRQWHYQVTSQQAVTGTATANTSYGYNQAGDTTSITSPAGSQALDWDHTGKLASDTVTGGTTPGTTS